MARVFQARNTFATHFFQSLHFDLNALDMVSIYIGLFVESNDKYAYLV